METEIFENLQEFVPQIIATAIVVVFLPLSKYIARKLIKKYGELLNKSDRRMLQVRKVISILINISFILAVAIIWGLRPQNILVGFATVATFVGVAMFAQWSMLSNITAGIILFFSSPFRLGDRIAIMDKDFPTKGIIEDIKTFYTHVRADDGEIVVLPNNLFLQKTVVLGSDTGEEDEM